MPTEESRSTKQLVRIGFVLSTIAALAAEYTLDRPSVPSWLRLVQVAFLVVGAVGIYQFSRYRSWSESVPSAVTMVGVMTMIALLWALDLGATILGTGGLPYELLLMLFVRDAALSAMALARNPVCLRLSGGLTLAAMLFSSVLAEHRVLYALSALYALLGSYWMILLYWSVIQVKLLEGTNRRPPVLAIAVWGLLVAGMTILIVGPRRTVGVLGELLPTSGGSSITDPTGQSGVGDGPNLARGINDPTTTGPVDSDLFLETRELSLYDSANEKWGEPEEFNKKRSLAIAIENPGGELQEERSRQSDPTREFSTVRNKRQRRYDPPEGTTDSSYSVRGKTPVHIRLIAFDTFDGRSWAEPEIRSERIDLRLGFAGWIEIPRESSGIDAGTVRHEIVVGSAEAPQIPLPTACDRFRIDLIERPDFFTQAQDSILRYRAEYLPKQTKLETQTPTVDPARLRRLEFPKGQFYALPKYLSTELLIETPNGIDREQLNPRIEALAKQWTQGLDRGWPQVEAIVTRLRNGYERDSDAVFPADCEDTVSHFLFDQRRGDDYAFASAACLLLRSLGYPSRFVQGLYADPQHIDEDSGWTSILMPRDLHTWAEVQLPSRDWIVVEATPGFEVLGPEPSLMARLWSGVLGIVHEVVRHPIVTTTVLLVTGVLYGMRKSITAGLVTLAWWLAFRGGASRWVIETVRLVERRAALSGRERPQSETLHAWYRRIAANSPDEPAQSAILRLSRLADWSLYAPPHRNGSTTEETESIRLHCQEAARVCTRSLLRAIPVEDGVTRRKSTGRNALLTRVGVVLLSIVIGLPRASAQEVELPELQSSPEISTETEETDVVNPVPVDSPPPQTEGVPGIELIDEMSDADEQSIATLGILTAVFFFIVGSAIGSFMNVVVYRMPRRMPLFGRQSHCPACEVLLTFRENLPIIGWLRLRGRCGSCSVPISPRYPLVEAGIGTITLVLLFVELLSGGESIPVRYPNVYNGVVWILWYPKWDLIGLFAYHMVLLCSVLCVTLIAGDRFRTPASLICFTTAIGYFAPMVVAELHPVPMLYPRPEWLPRSGLSLAEAGNSLVGHLVGLVIGVMLYIGGKKTRGIIAIMSLAGLYLGWQAALSTGLLAGTGMVFVAGMSKVVRSVRMIPQAGPAAVAVLVQILAWRWLSGLSFWPSHDSSSVEIVGACVLMGLLSILLWWLTPQLSVSEGPVHDDVLHPPSDTGTIQNMAEKEPIFLDATSENPTEVVDPVQEEGGPSIS